MNKVTQERLAAVGQRRRQIHDAVEALSDEITRLIDERKRLYDEDEALWEELQ